MAPVNQQGVHVVAGLKVRAAGIVPLQRRTTPRQLPRPRLERCTLADRS